MIRTIITLAAIFAVTSPALAQNPDHPHRDWGKVATLDMPLIDATSCIGRELNRAGDAMIVPVEGGNDIDWTAHVPWGKKMEPWMTFQLRGAGDRTILRVLYRRPIGPGRVSKDITKMQKRCLKVESIAPAQ